MILCQLADVLSRRISLWIFCFEKNDRSDFDDFQESRKVKIKFYRRIKLIGDFEEEKNMIFLTFKFV